MKKVFLAVLLVLSLSVMLHAQESTETSASGAGAKGFDWDIRFGFSFPFIGNADEAIEMDGVAATALSLLLAPALSSLSLGATFQYTVVPKLLAPGIYADIQFNLLTWFFVGVFSNWEKNFLLLQPEIRLYNQFQLSDSFGIEPFFGFNFMYINVDTFKESIPLMNAGVVLKMGSSFGFEYSYNFSNRKAVGAWSPKIHRIGFSWALRDRG